MRARGSLRLSVFLLTLHGLLVWAPVRPVAAQTAPASPGTARAHDRPTPGALVQTTGLDLDALRTDFVRAVDQPALVEELESRVTSAYPAGWRTAPPVVAAYYASVIGLKAKFSRRIGVKFEYVNTAIEIFDTLVAENPRSLEVRFLRYSFNEQIPRIFGAAHLVREDLDIMLDQLAGDIRSDATPEVRRLVIMGLLQSSTPSVQERELLRTYLDG